MKRPTVHVTIRDESGATVRYEPRSAFNAGVRASEAGIRAIALDENTVYEGDRPVRVGDVYTRRWTSRRGRVLTATVEKIAAAPETSSGSSRAAGWSYYARRGSDSEVVRVSREVAEQIAASPANSRTDYLALWLVPPFYAREAKWRVERGFVPLAWEYLRGKLELPPDFLAAPEAWLERMKAEER